MTLAYGAVAVVGVKVSGFESAFGGLAVVLVLNDVVVGATLLNMGGVTVAAYYDAELAEGVNALGYANLFVPKGDLIAVSELGFPSEKELFVLALASPYDVCRDDPKVNFRYNVVCWA